MNRNKNNRNSCCKTRGGISTGITRLKRVGYFGESIATIDVFIVREMHVGHSGLQESPEVTTV